MRDDQEFIERRIITGLIVSNDYVRRVERFLKLEFLESLDLQMVAGWCLNYWEQYHEAPGRNIEAIYIAQLQNRHLEGAEAEYIEELLSSLSDDFDRGHQFNAAYLYDQTIEYFRRRELNLHQQEIEARMEMGEVEEAERLARTFSPTVTGDWDKGLDLSSEDALERIDRAFTFEGQQVIEYPGALGRMWNDQMVRGGFVSLLAPEKRGKTFMLLELALRAARQKAHVAFFEVGDMTEAQILRRICVYVAQRSDRERYAGPRLIPVGDCGRNQMDICERGDRNCDHGVWSELTQEEWDRKRFSVTMEELADKLQENPDYEPCDSHLCDNRWGCVWLKQIPGARPLTAEQAKDEVRSFFQRYRRSFKLTCQPAGTFSVSDMRTYLSNWERYDGFVPDVIVVDYADLLSAHDSSTKEYRHHQDHIWKSLRALSQEKHALVLTATQADAAAYNRGHLTMSNFSEDKRKLSHVTAQYGLNQDPKGREKALGIIRINEIVVREGEFNQESEVHVLQDLAAGRPFLESF